MGPGEIHIRPAEAGELPELQRVERQAGTRFRGLGLLDHLLEHSLSLPELSGHQRSGRVWVAADERDRPVGFAVASVVGGGAHLEVFDAQGSHVGEAKLDGTMIPDTRDATKQLAL